MVLSHSCSPAPRVRASCHLPGVFDDDNALSLDLENLRDLNKSASSGGGAAEDPQRPQSILKLNDSHTGLGERPLFMSLAFDATDKIGPSFFM
ncbi:hypothetical protein EVAR_90947_1 [Eumeta japonica]|uniref:Uncharacterized protein n=1 Tax=Eumeta variegata TaxID=151549 RepID=A0A4C1SJQ1_EUMVA|nr:hypothetical protein EVAR_90947_1 [Eumeta japonica]